LFAISTMTPRQQEALQAYLKAGTYRGAARLCKMDDSRSRVTFAL
jgi:hypothetical protein